MKNPTGKKTKKSMQTLDCSKINACADMYKPILLKKLRFEFCFFMVSYYSLIMQNLFHQNVSMILNAA